MMQASNSCRVQEAYVTVLLELGGIGLDVK